jgi:hypothetical protein
MPDRRYNDDEVAEIFARAAEGPKAPALQPGRDDGLSLAQLQEIGREVGIAPEAVAQAAQALDRQGKAGTSTLIGLPIGVERVVALERPLTETEWEHLVVRLREVFNAKGTISSYGSFRSWTNGNLQALLEPTATGQRLRLRTIKGSARSAIVAGLGTIGISLVTALAVAPGGHLLEALRGILVITAAGAGLIGYGTLQLPGWARTRRRQMEAIVEGLSIQTEPEPGRLPPSPAP